MPDVSRHRQPVDRAFVHLFMDGPSMIARLQKLSFGQWYVTMARNRTSVKRGTPTMVAS